LWFIVNAIAESSGVALVVAALRATDVGCRQPASVELLGSLPAVLGAVIALPDEFPLAGRHFRIVVMTERGEEEQIKAAGRWVGTGYKTSPNRASGQATAKLS
jgi:hypothetical protein